MTGWITTTLGKLCDDGGGEVRTGPFGSQLHEADYSPTGTPVVMPKDFAQGWIDENSIARVSDDHVQRLSQHKLKLGDIVYGRRGDIGRRALITGREEGWLCGTGCLRISINTGTDPRFLYYLLGHPETVADIRNRAVGSTMANLNTKILRETEVCVPTADTQRRIGSILSAYDDLIEVNRRRVSVLEEMARGLFEEWFVRFRFPGHETVPILDTPDGPLPEGWMWTTASSLIDFDPKTSLTKGGEKPFISMGLLDTQTSFIGKHEMRIGGSGAKFKNNDTLFARITPCLENGKTGIVRNLQSSDGIGFGSTEFIVMRGRRAGPAFSYCLARNEAFRSHARGSMSGASGRQRARTESVKSFQLASPVGDELLADFERHAWPMLTLVGGLCEANENLAASRDLLLPRLISGELSVANAERQLEEVA